MSPIITHEDEKILAKSEKELASQIKKSARAQATLVDSQKKVADNIIKGNTARELLNRIFRDVFKQMQVLAREHRSNIKAEEVNLFQEIIRQNDQYIEGGKNYLNAIKDLAIQKEYYIGTKIEFADALADVADKRKIVINKALSIEKVKNKMIEGEKLNLLDQELNDVQREFDRARGEYLKKIDQFLTARKELNAVWTKLKDAVSELS